MSIQESYCAILREELVLAAGCTEPIAIAYAAAVARDHLQDMPERLVVNCSGNIIKNVKSVKIPNTKGARGIDAAAIAGMVAGDQYQKLEVIEHVSEEQVEQILEYLNKKIVTVNFVKDVPTLYVELIAYAKDSYAKVVIMHTHINVTLIEKNGVVVYESKGDYTAIEGEREDRSVLNIQDIIEFGRNGNIDAVRDLIETQIKVNYDIAMEGLKNDWGSCVGKTMAQFTDDIYYRGIAAAAAASDARMSGCSLPVMTNSGSGNQGLTLSVPIIEYAKKRNIDHEKLVRALVVSNLVNVHIKTGVGRLSAYCGVVCAATACFAGLAFLDEQPLDVIEKVITNTIATDSGIICDGAKESCASKIATSLFAGLLGYQMTKNNHTFPQGCGIVQESVDDTIKAVGTVAHEGMRITDEVILGIMINNE